MANKGKGFTLIELLIVIAVIGIISAVLMVAINPLTQTAKARDAARKSYLAQLKRALENYYVVHGSYPEHCDATGVYSTNPQPWIPELVNDGELKTVPVDPKNVWVYPDGDKTFAFVYHSKKIDVFPTRTIGSCDTQYFVIGTHLENSNDAAINWNREDFYSGWFVNYVVTDRYP